MILYLLKATLVWGLSLFLFEGLLRKNSYHAANRLYLLGTLLAGLLLPLVELQWSVPAAVLPASDFLQTATATTQTIAATVSDEGTSSSPLTINTLWLFLYAAGFGIALARVVRDAASLTRLRRLSKKEALPAGCTLYETGADHGPFSYFRAIFLSSRETYTASELAMVISHERQHARLLHSVDMLLVQVLKVVLWFHPLTHLYTHRLRLVHEYEADEAAAQEPTIYGRFLVEQALAAPASTLTHAFHSPIKTRIAMLTKNNRSRSRALGYFLTLPLIAALVAGFSLPAYTDERKQVGNKLFYNGNEFTMTEQRSDTMIVQDARTGNDMTIVTNLEPRPVSVSGEPIYDSEFIVRGAVYAGKEATAATEYFNRIRPILSELPNGVYVISIGKIVVSKKGKMIYNAGANIWSCPSCEPQPSDPAIPDGLTRNQSSSLDKDLEQRVSAAISRELEHGFPFKPAEKAGVTVNAFLRGDLDPDRGHMVVVEGGKARMRTD